MAGFGWVWCGTAGLGEVKQGLVGYGSARQGLVFIHVLQGAFKLTRSRRIEVRAVAVRKIQKASLPLHAGEVIDLEQAYKELKPLFDVRYNPEYGFKGPGMHVVIEKVSYLIFRNGTVMIMGNLSSAKEEAFLKLIWRNHLCQCLV